MVPTITSVSPVAGPAGGRQLVQITGTGFRLAPAPPASGPAPTPAPSVQVTFGGLKATQVAVLSALSLLCLTPVSALGAVDVAVQNCDDTGAPIPGEIATAAGAYTFQLTKLVVPSDLVRVEYALVKAFMQQVCPNAMLTVDTDYSSDTVDGLSIPDVTHRPALVLLGPSMEEDPIYNVAVYTLTPVTDGAGNLLYSKVKAPSVSMALHYQLVVIAANREGLLSMMVDAVEFRRRMPELAVDRSATDPTLGQVKFRLHLTDQPHMTTMPNLSNLRTFALGLVVRGVPIAGTRGDDDARVFDRAYPTDTITVGVSPEAV
jgi:hypothetical protein